MTKHAIDLENAEKWIVSLHLEESQKLHQVKNDQMGITSYLIVF